MSMSPRWSNGCLVVYEDYSEKQQTINLHSFSPLKNGSEWINFQQTSRRGGGVFWNLDMRGESNSGRGLVTSSNLRGHIVSIAIYEEGWAGSQKCPIVSNDSCVGRLQSLLVSNCEFRLVLSNLIVLSVCSHSFPYGEHLCRVLLAWLNCPPYVFGLTCRILLKSSVTNRHSGHWPVISPESCDQSITTFDTLPLRIVRSLQSTCHIYRNK
jgi:hypothetical protein